MLLEITTVLKARLEARTITNSEMSTLLRCLKDLGLIIRDRQPVEKAKPKEDKLSELGV